MGIGVGTAIAISAGTSMITANKQQEAQEDAVNEQNRLNEEAQAQEELIFQQQALQDAQDAEKQTAVYGQDDDEELGSYNDFITPTSAPSTTGLGSMNNSTGLGF